MTILLVVLVFVLLLLTVLHHVSFLYFLIQFNINNNQREHIEHPKVETITYINNVVWDIQNRTNIKTTRTTLIIMIMGEKNQREKKKEKVYFFSSSAVLSFCFIGMMGIYIHDGDGHNKVLAGFVEKKIQRMGSWNKLVRILYN